MPRFMKPGGGGMTTGVKVRSARTIETENTMPTAARGIINCSAGVDWFGGGKTERGTGERGSLNSRSRRRINAPLLGAN